MRIMRSHPKAKSKVCVCSAEEDELTRAVCGNGKRENMKPNKKSNKYFLPRFDVISKSNRMDKKHKRKRETQSE